MSGFGSFPFASTPFGAPPASGVEVITVTEGLLASGDGAGTLIKRIAELMAVNDPLASAAELQTTVTEAIAVGDLSQFVYRALITEGFTVGGDAASQFTAIHIVTDALRLSGVASSRLEAMQLVVAGIAFGNLADAWAKVTVTDGVAVNAAVQDALTAAMRLVEGILLGGIPSNYAVFGAVVRENVAIDDAPDSVLDALAIVREGLALTLRVNAEGDERIAYLINTETKALTRFTQWPFNSYAKHPGNRRYYGMTPDGIRRIFDDATTDDGAAIGARVRLSMGNLGSSREKRMQAAYLGYTATGELRLKAIVVASDGEKVAYTYRLRAQGAGAPRQARLKIGEGLKSVYWGFELEAIDGAAFELDLLQLLPLLLEGRLNGEGGGLR